MDLISEASSGSRVLSARHISADEPLPTPNTAINTSLLCHSYSLQPDVGTYVEALQGYTWILWLCGVIVLLATCGVFAATLRSALRNWRDCGASAAVVLAVYPLVSAAALLALVVPRARLISEALAQQAVMTAMYHLYCMIIAECGGTEKLVRLGGDSMLETRVLPCCCWPCCVIPRPKLQKKSLSWLRFLVLQMAVIQAILYIIILVLWAEDMILYMNSFIYIQPFVIISILSGVWGIIMTVRVAESAGLTPRPRFLALQLVLIIVKLQCGLAKVVSEMIELPCLLSLNPTVMVHMIQNIVMMLEMLLLSIWAWWLYRIAPSKAVAKVQQVIVSISTIDDGGADKGIKDGADTVVNNNDDISTKH